MNIIELYNQLLKELGLTNSYSRIYKVEGNDLITLEDKSYHGSSNWVEVRRQKLSESEVKVISTLLSIQSDVNKVANMKEIAKIEEEINSLQSRLNLLKEVS